MRISQSRYTLHMSNKALWTHFFLACTLFMDMQVCDRVRVYVNCSNFVCENKCCDYYQGCSAF
jgi:hypothetical protein